MNADNVVVFKIHETTTHHMCLIHTDDERGLQSDHYKLWAEDGTAFLDLYDDIVIITSELREKGYEAVFMLAQ